MLDLPQTPPSAPRETPSESLPAKESDLIRRVVPSGSRDAANESGIELHRVETLLGPARYGYDFETVEFLMMKQPGSVIDLPLRASYGLSLLRGSCVVVWRERDPESDALLGRETAEQFAMRVGTIQKLEDGRLWFRKPEKPLRGLQTNWGLLPGDHAGMTPPYDIYLGPAFQVTLIALEADTALAVLSSDGPGDPDLRTPKPPSVS